MKNLLVYNFCMKMVNNLSGTRFFKIKRKLLNFAGISIGSNSKVVGPINISRAARLQIGENVWIGKGFEIYGNGEVEIGDNCDFGPDVTFFTGSHEIGDVSRRAGKELKFDYKIGNGNWVGGKTSFINGASIGCSNVIGASTLVTKSYQSDLLIMGSPAKVIRKL